MDSCDQDCASTIIRIVARSALVKNLMVEHNVATHKRGRANAGGLKVSEFYSQIEDLPETITPQRLVDATLAIAGINHPKVVKETTDCNPDVFIDFVSWLDQAIPWSGIGKYQRIKLYKENPCANAKIATRNCAFN